MLVSMVVGWSSIVVPQMFSDSIYTTSRAQMLVAIFVHDHPVYNVCPEVISTVGGNSKVIWFGFMESDKVLTIFLFIYLCLRCKVCSCPDIQIKIIF